MQRRKKTEKEKKGKIKKKKESFTTADRHCEDKARILDTEFAIVTLHQEMKTSILMIYLAEGSFSCPIVDYKAGHRHLFEA